MPAMQYNTGIGEGFDKDAKAANSVSQKQLDIISRLNEVISQEGISLTLNPSHWYCNEEIAVDVEHDEQGNLVGIGVCNNQMCIYFTEVTDEVKAGLETCQLIMHNGVSDIECLRMWEINVRDDQLHWDSMLIGHLLDSSLKSYGLKDMAKRELGIVYPSYDDIVGKRGLKTPRVTLDKQPIELTSKYNALDCFVTYRLYEKQRKAIGNDRIR